MQLTPQSNQTHHQNPILRAFGRDHGRYSQVFESIEASKC